MATKTTPGVLYRHSRECPDRARCDKTCNDSPEPWEAWVYDAKFEDPTTGRRGKKIRQRFATYAAAKGWRADAIGAVKRRTLRAVDRATAAKTLSEEIRDWLAGARAGEIRSKRETPYKPAVIRNYELALRLRVEPTMGDRRFTDITLGDLLELKEQLQGAGVSDSTVRNSFVPLQAIYRRARLQQRIQVDPTTDLPLPTAGRRERAATPVQAAELLEAFDRASELLTWVDKEGKEHVPDYRAEAAAFAAAFYAGLRRGELRALRVRNVDLDAGTIDVKHGWDDKEGEIDPKSKAGRRTVFVADVLAPYLRPLVESRPQDELVFGQTSAPFEPRSLARKAERAWGAADKARAELEQPPLERFTLHEARHSFSTWMDSCGISETRADRYMGHADPTVAGRYRHPLPAQLADDRKVFDAFVAGAASGKVVAIAAAG